MDHNSNSRKRRNIFASLFLLVYSLNHCWSKVPLSSPLDAGTITRDKNNNRRESPTHLRPRLKWSLGRPLRLAVLSLCVVLVLRSAMAVNVMPTNNNSNTDEYPKDNNHRVNRFSTTTATESPVAETVADGLVGTGGGIGRATTTALEGSRGHEEVEEAANRSPGSSTTLSHKLVVTASTATGVQSSTTTPPVTTLMTSTSNATISTNNSLPASSSSLDKSPMHRLRYSQHSAGVYTSHLQHQLDDEDDYIDVDDEDEGNTANGNPMWQGNGRKKNSTGE